LIGDADPRFATAYRDSLAPFVIFDLPYAAAVDIAGGLFPGRQGRIQATTNPETVRSWRSQALFQKFQVTEAELREKYPSLAVYETKKA
jgi:hypothetical protein